MREFASTWLKAYLGRTKIYLTSGFASHLHLERRSTAELRLDRDAAVMEECLVEGCDCLELNSSISTDSRRKSSRWFVLIRMLMTGTDRSK